MDSTTPQFVCRKKATRKADKNNKKNNKKKSKKKKKKQKQKFNLLAVYDGAIMYTKVNEIHFIRCKPALSCFINSIQHSYRDFVMFEAVYIADRQENLVYEYLVQLHAPHLQLLVNYLKLKKEEKNDPSSQQVMELNNRSFVCSSITQHLTFYVLCLKNSEDELNPLTPFVFLDRLLEVMQEYFGTPLSSTKIDANNDTLTLILNEMIDDGVPHITDVNKLRELVLLKSLLSKILSTSNELAAAATNKSLASLSSISRSSRTQDSIPWRKSNVRYTNNEVFVDIIETVNVILKPKSGRHVQPSTHNFDSAFYSNAFLGTKLIPVTGTILGEIDCLCHISGVPLLQVDFNSAASLVGVPLFHPCIKLDTWMRAKSLSFIPPDGQSTLMTYQVDMDTLLENAQLGMLNQIDFQCQLELGSRRNEFELRFNIPKHHAINKIDSLSVEIIAGYPDISKNEEKRLETSNDEISNMKSIRVSHGDFRYQGNGKAEWSIKNMITGVQPILRASIMTSNSNDDFLDSSSESSQKENLDLGVQQPVSPLYYKLRFTYKGNVPSGLKVDSLKVTSIKGLGENVKPYKGVRYVTKSGDYTVRTK